jgi:hypothetical protein
MTSVFYISYIIIFSFILTNNLMFSFWTQLSVGSEITTEDMIMCCVARAIAHFRGGDRSVLTNGGMVINI